MDSQVKPVFWRASPAETDFNLPKKAVVGRNSSGAALSFPVVSQPHYYSIIVNNSLEIMDFF